MNGARFEALSHHRFDTGKARQQRSVTMKKPYRSLGRERYRTEEIFKLVRIDAYGKQSQEFSVRPDNSPGEDHGPFSEAALGNFDHLRRRFGVRFEVYKVLLICDVDVRNRPG